MRIDRPLVVLAAAAFLLADATLIWIGISGDFGFDFTCCYQQAAQRVLDDPARLYDWSDTYTFRYTPLGALFFIPLAPLSEGAAVWAWLVFKAAVLLVAAWWFSNRWTGRRRWLVAAAVVTFPPVLHDLVIGNVSTLTLIVFLALMRWTDWRGGLAIGLLTLLMPKPHLIPVLVYAAIRLPRAALAAAVVMVGGVGVGLLAFGVGPWADFVRTLSEPLGRTFTANIGWSGLLGPPGVGIGVVLAAAILGLGVWTGGPRGYGLAIVSGILAGPYTFIHYLAGTIVAAEPVLRSRPRWLAPFPWLLVVFPFIPIWLTGLGGVLRRAPDPGEPPATERRAAAQG